MNHKIKSINFYTTYVQSKREAEFNLDGRPGQPRQRER